MKSNNVNSLRMFYDKPGEASKVIVHENCPEIIKEVREKLLNNNYKKASNKGSDLWDC